MSVSKPPINSINGGPPADAYPTPHTPEQQRRLDLIAELKAAYVREKCRWVAFRKGYELAYQLPERFEKCWPKLAGIIEQHRLPVVAYIHAQFHGGRVPEPNMLTTEQALEKFYRFATQLQHGLAARLQAETLAFEVAVTTARAAFPSHPLPALWQRSLLDDTVQLSPLFRYCVGYAEGFADVCAEYGRSALDQYLTFPSAYDEQWQNVIPSVLQQQANEELKGFANGFEPTDGRGCS